MAQKKTWLAAYTSAQNMTSFFQQCEQIVVSLVPNYLSGFLYLSSNVHEFIYFKMRYDNRAKFRGAFLHAAEKHLPPTLLQFWPYGTFVFQLIGSKTFSINSISRENVPAPSPACCCLHVANENLKRRQSVAHGTCPWDEQPCFFQNPQMYGVISRVENCSISGSHSSHADSDKMLMLSIWHVVLAPEEALMSPFPCKEVRGGTGSMSPGYFQRKYHCYIDINVGRPCLSSPTLKGMPQLSNHQAK